MRTETQYYGIWRVKDPRYGWFLTEDGNGGDVCFGRIYPTDHDVTLWRNELIA